MATQSELEQPVTAQDTASSSKAQSGRSSGKTVDSGGNAQNVADKPDLAWELVKEECHDILEQLPLTLQRNFSLMRDLDEQVAAHLQAIPTVLQEYLSLRMKLAQDVVMVDEHSPRQPSRAASFSSASLTPITESPPSTRSQDDEEEEVETEETEETDHDTSMDTRGPPKEPTSTDLIKQVATLATNAVRGSLEKVNLSNAAYAAIDRHIRALDIAIAEQENAIDVGRRSGTRPSAIAGIPALNGATPLSPITPTANGHRHSQSFESNNLLALAEVASAVHAAEKTLEVIQPTSRGAKPTLEKDGSPDRKNPHGLAGEPEKRGRGRPRKKPLPPQEQQQQPQQQPQQQQPPPQPQPQPQTRPQQHVKKSTKKEKENVVLAEPDEPTYCYCNRVSFGKMIACDNDNCKREWFHWECAGITRAPPATAKWYCRDCEAQEPAAKRRRKR